MKIACVYPDTPNWPKFAWVHQALERIGHHVCRVATATELVEANAAADLVLFMQKSPGIRAPEIIRLAGSRRAVWAQWWFDLLSLDADKRLEEQGYVRSFGSLMRSMDVVFVKERGLIPDYQALGINAVYLDQGFPNDFASRVQNPAPEFHVLVWGQGGADYRRRTADARALAESGFRVAWSVRDGSAPDGVVRLPWCPPDELPELAGRATCVLSVDRRHDLAGYWSDRFWLAAGMGCCVLRRFTPGLPEGPYVVYATTEELIAAAREIMQNNRSAELGEKAREWVLSHHTIEHRCRRMLDAVRQVAASVTVPG